MRILVVSPFLPHPATDHGGGVYLGTFLEALGQEPGLELALACFFHSGMEESLPGIQVHSLPYRRNEELGRLGLWGRRIIRTWQWGLRAMPLLAAKHRMAAFRRLLRRVQAEFQPDLVLVEFASMAQYLPDIDRSRGSKTILTDHERGEALPRGIGPGPWGRRRDARLWQAYVRRYYPLADLCQTLNKEDAQGLEAMLGHELRVRVRVRPPVVRLPVTSVRPQEAGPVLLFMGDFLHHPNPEAALFLAKAVLPRLRGRLPEAELWLAGPRAGPEIQALHGLEGLRTLGFVPDLAGLLAQVRCLLAPVFSGSGVRIKVLTALAHGLPVVANELGLLGVDAPEQALARGETAEELAAACLTFLQDPAAAGQAGAAGRRWATEELSAAKLVSAQLELFSELLSEPRPGE